MSELPAVQWTELPGDIIGTGNIANKIDPSATGGQRFYQLQVLP